MAYPARMPPPLSRPHLRGDHHGMPTELQTHSLPTRRYKRHEPEKTPLYSIVANHLEQLNQHLTLHETSLPVFVQREFADYLRCGRLEHGFLQVKCMGCRHEQLVAFSCKRRGFCRGRPVRRAAHDA